MVIDIFFVLFCFACFGLCKGCNSILLFYGCLKLRFPDVEVNPVPKAVPQCCRVMFSNINGVHGNRDELAITATKFDVVASLACAETKVYGLRHLSELILPFKVPTLLLRGGRPVGLSMCRMALFARSSLSILRQERSEFSFCEFMVTENSWWTVEMFFFCQ